MQIEMKATRNAFCGETVTLRPRKVMEMKFENGKY